MTEPCKEVNINGHTYVRKDVQTEGLQYVIIRTNTAGVFAGYLDKREGQEVTLKNARRLWYWSGAASLSQLAEEGVRKPNECKFPCEVSSIVLTQAIEIINCTEKARLSIAGVPIWKS